ncbi:Peptidase A1 domain-containing protein [Aphelenchoides fujianensis]|nr:Peptidase A1 domain-containing protein [Aphelenchoides fujianensis]
MNSVSCLTSVNRVEGTTSNRLWVFDQQYPDLQQTQHAYNASQSSSSTYENDDFYTERGNLYTYGSWYEDQTSLFGLPAQSQWFGSTLSAESTLTGDDISLPFDGVLGLAWSLGNEGEGEDASPIVTALKGAEKRQVTIWFNATLSTTGVTESKVTIGGNDPDHCQLDNIFDDLYVPLTLYKGEQLSIVLEQFYFGDHFESPATFATLDTSSPTLHFPPLTYQVIFRKAQPDFDWTREILTIDCTKGLQLPDMAYTINNVEFDVGPQYFVVDVGLGNNQCAFAIDIDAGDYDRGSWVLGTPFHRLFCTTYDLDAQTVLINLAVGQDSF